MYVMRSTNISNTIFNVLQCSLLNRITLHQHKFDNITREIQLTVVFYLLFSYNETYNLDPWFFYPWSN